ncbi:U-box domain-containing protein 26 [Dichanthelium oligosanthes]|uniref:U-box domain-containing protein n=1 Tax=Dichanthelium oligosanthes TaxID=888268 RepID=A0A1E5VW86_9POAL|nr:U-box domain-containing protein 26 [Dichanthelium oligosanthes]
MPGSVPLALGLDTAGLQVPWYFRCPISLELMRDPVTVSTGQTYDRASIESWVATGNTTCPVTRAPLADFTLIPNHTLRRLIQEWCVAHRSMGVERIPTPKQPADPDLVRSLVAQGPGLPALRRLRALARESDKNRLVMATRETRAALVEVAFGSGSGASEELEAEAMAVLALVGLGEAEAAEVVGREERVARLGKVLAGGPTLEARVNAGAVVEAAASASGAEARASLGAAEGVMEGLVALVEEKANARAVRVGIRGLFALCLAKENRPRAVSAGAAFALARRVAEGGGAGEPERALAAVERLCRAEGGRDAVVAGAGGGSAAVTALVRAMSGRAAEHAAGALVAVVGGSEVLQVEAVRAGAMSQLLLMVQGGCSERAKRKAQHLLKLLRSAWPTTDCIANSDDFLQPY